MGIIATIIISIIAMIIMAGVYSEFKFSYDFGDTWGMIKYGLILVLIGLGVIFISINAYTRYSIRTEFEGYINSYSNINTYTSKNRNSIDYNSKFIIIDKDNSEIHDHHFFLPENNKAVSPIEVDYIVWLEFEETFYSYFGTDSNPRRTKAYVEHCIISIIDINTKELISRKRISGRGSDTISYRRRSGAPKKKVFSAPRSQIINYIVK